MKRSNSEILNKVKNLVSGKNQKNLKAQIENIKSTESNVDLELKKWIENNAEKIAREIILNEVKKIFK